MSFGKKDICINISSKALIPKDKSKDFFETFLNLVSSKSKSKVVKISNFGTFYCKNTPQRLGRNPKTKEEFINQTKVDSPLKKIKGRVQTVTFTLNNLDLETLEQQLDRAILLKKRTKSKSAVIRMALRALENTSDEEYSDLYSRF